MDRIGLREERLRARKALERAGKLPFKFVSSAKWVDIERSWTGRIHVRIEHDTVRGCTPEMIRWWFENLGQRTTWDGIGFDGPEISFYHLWHHRDHVSVIPLTGKNNKGFAVHKSSQITEQFNDHHKKIKVDVWTERLDDKEFNFVIKKIGLTGVRINHFYSGENDGSRFYVETIAGLGIPFVGWIFNWIFLPFVYSKRTAEHWIAHNVEETGRSESIIPVLYNREKEASDYLA
ncbi:uncharacterized protein N7498_000009 [Penicillium cinerascens]|uniref:DAPG hydrolase PhiG domain-containing protein n=1 Tax=Penicillium cinerascens TaxID=70096 RepID=A0A9W9TDV2_9EURO|nr:uncharacterized protein N7498_000009 [Penicillium cinerascens]KAJ5217910.1 hypothetical protein N7498_000009 [Penicillium cinerascens]